MHRLAGFMRTYWTRGEPGRPTPPSLVVFMLRMWLVALGCKLLGSSWDVSWHFKWLRDDLAAAHVLNTVGTGIAVGLVLAHSFTGYGTDRRSLRIMQIGTGIFLLAGPIDVINHRINGLDLTAWSPSHMLLYGGTAIMIAGVIRSWYHAYPTDGRHARQWRWGLVALWAFMFENMFFPTGQQEYGILEIASWFRGLPYAEPELIGFAAAQLGRPVDDIAIESFAMPIGPWVYPVWSIAICAAVLVAARIMVGSRWTATLVVGGYVAYRCLIWPILTFTIFPPSVVPFWLLVVGIAVDAVFLLPLKPLVRAVVGAVAVTIGGYVGMWLQTVVFATPTDLAQLTIAEMRLTFEAGNALHMVPVEWTTAWLAALGLLATWSAVTVVAKRSIGLDSPRPPTPTLSYGPEPVRDARNALDGWAELPGHSSARTGS
jgi:hypothetical protein